MPLNLRHKNFKEALIEAKNLSRLTNEEIANRTGFDSPSVSRYFSQYDSYHPSPERIPAISRALGNTVICDWFPAQVQDMEHTLMLETAQDLSLIIMQTTQNNGKLAKLGVEALADMDLSQREARDLQAQIRENIKLLNKLDGALEPIAKGDRL